MVPATHIRLFLTTLESAVLPLFIVSISFCFSFSSLSLPLICSSWWHLGFLNIWHHFRNSLRHIRHYVYILESGKGHFRHGLRCDPDWWSFKATSLFGPYSDCLVVGAHLSGPMKG